MYISNIYRGAWAWGTPVSTPWSAPSLYVILDCFFIILIQYNIRMFFLWWPAEPTNLHILQ